MVEPVKSALAARGIDDEVGAGEFNPPRPQRWFARGRTLGAARWRGRRGGLRGGLAGGNTRRRRRIGAAGQDAGRGLDTTVYGFAAPSGRDDPRRSPSGPASGPDREGPPARERARPGTDRRRRRLESRTRGQPGAAHALQGRDQTAPAVETLARSRLRTACDRETPGIESGSASSARRLVSAVGGRAAQAALSAIATPRVASAQLTPTASNRPPTASASSVTPPSGPVKKRPVMRPDIFGRANCRRVRLTT
jgi:hypothetical protein